MSPERAAEGVAKELFNTRYFPFITWDQIDPTVRALKIAAVRADYTWRDEPCSDCSGHFCTMNCGPAVKVEFGHDQRN
jgi:hypothetical protein